MKATKEYMIETANIEGHIVECAFDVRHVHKAIEQIPGIAKAAICNVYRLHIVLGGCFDQKEVLAEVECVLKAHLASIAATSAEA